jgi:hypothetical protein
MDRRRIAPDQAQSEWLTSHLVLATAVQGELWGPAMLYQKYLLHYHAVRQAVTAVVTIGMALACSYLILAGHF